MRIARSPRLCASWKTKNKPENYIKKKWASPHRQVFPLNWKTIINSASSIITNMSQNNNTNVIPTTTVTRDLRELDASTGNIYESIVVIGKRANQIAVDVKEELNQKLSEFASTNDNLEEVFENREQIEISKHYERMPKPSLVALDEFLNDKIYFRNPAKEQE